MSERHGIVQFVSDDLHAGMAQPDDFARFLLDASLTRAGLTASGEPALIEWSYLSEREAAIVRDTMHPAARAGDWLLRASVHVSD